VDFNNVTSGALFVITLDYAIDLIEDVMEIFKNEKTVESKHSKCIVFVGDIHGDLTAWNAIRSFLKEENALFVFLGDYVDRGNNSLEIIVDLLELKRADPSKFILLRGNHETKEINEYYGFLWELQRKIPTNYHILYEKFNEVFSQMPIAVTINDNQIIGIHGGIPIQAESISNLMKIPKGMISITNPLLLQVLWNDPDDSISNYAPSPRGPGIYLFGWKIFNTFMNNSESKYLIRGHTYLPEGARYFFNGKLLSIFSPLNYVGQRVKGKIAIFCDNNLKLIDLETYRK